MRAPEEAPLLIGDLRASAAAHEELTWFFERALAEIELPSNFEQVARSAIIGRRRRRRGAERPVDGGAERRAEALEAARRIHGRLMLLTTTDREVLRAVFASGEGDDGGDGVGVSAGSIARALAAYERTRCGESVVPEKDEEED